MKKLSGSDLKFIALFFMTVDHVGWILLDNYAPFRLFGRLAFPIFAYCVTEGIRHTSDKYKYLIRMFVFALLSEIPYKLATWFNTDTANIMWSYFFAIFGIALYEKYKESPYAEISLFLTVAIAYVIKLDYGIYGILMIFGFYFLNSIGCNLQTTGMIMLMTLYPFLNGNCRQMFCVFSLIPIAMYNGKKGRGFKWLFYAYYPLHLLSIFIIRFIQNYEKQ